MTTSPEQFDQNLQIVPDEEAVIGVVPDLNFTLAPNAYDSDNRLARERRVRARETFPQEMSADVITDLGQKVYRMAYGATKAEGPEQDAHRAGRRAEGKFLRWLADSGTQDVVTAHSARRVLRHKHGFGGKLAAAWFSAQDIWSH